MLLGLDIMVPLMSGEELLTDFPCHSLQCQAVVLPQFDRLQAVFLGLDIVVPLMSGELLAVPKLARLYFGLLSYLAEIWPGRLATLPGALHCAACNSRLAGKIRSAETGLFTRANRLCQSRPGSSYGTGGQCSRLQTRWDRHAT